MHQTKPCRVSFTLCLLLFFLSFSYLSLSFVFVREFVSYSVVFIFYVQTDIRTGSEISPLKHRASVNGSHNLRLVDTNNSSDILAAYWAKSLILF